MTTPLSLQDVRDLLREMREWKDYFLGRVMPCDMADAIDAEISRRGEAVAWCCADDPTNTTAFAWCGTARDPARHTTPLYAAPPAQKLTVDDAAIDRALNAQVLGSTRTVAGWLRYKGERCRAIMRAALTAAVEGHNS